MSKETSVWSQRAARLLPPMLACLLGACSTGQMGEPATLHAVQVVEVETRADILASRGMHEALAGAGVSDAAIADGSVVTARLMCCGPPESSNPHGFYNRDPKSLPLSVGDVIEVRLGGDSKVNEVTRVLQPANQADGPCWWDPKDDRLWRRVMFCEWMPTEGWVKQGGVYSGWYKAASSTAGGSGR
ncbi:MAG: hypothetical protein JSR36_15205 [Proteobacteria bacterium]|nr:hypothetical protein [Pseudomonadota bacterium]